MAVVESFKVGNTKIRIHDDCCVGREECEKIRKRIEDRVNGYVREGSYKIN